MPRLRLARLLPALALLPALGAPAPEPAGAREVDTRPAVARPRLVLGEREVGSGTVFFLRAEDPAGAVAVGAAHSFDRGELRRAGRVEFRLARTERLVAASSALHAPPGRPFSEGVPLREDYLVFALEAPPRGARVLRAAREPGELEGERVRILGAPAAIAQDEDDIFGTVEEMTDSRIEVRLDVPADLRGWGGAPVLLDGSDRVLGLLEAAWPDGNTLRVGVAPIGGVLEALERPYPEAGGRPLAELEEEAEERVAEAGDSASGPAERAPRPGGEGPAPDAARAEAGVPVSRRAAPSTPDEGETLLGRAGPLETEVRLEIEHPADGAVTGESAGAYVAGRAVAHVGELRRFDVVFVLDTSNSANRMTGADVNGNGVVGKDRLSGLFGNTDPGDSVLAAEVAAAERLLRGLDPRNTRVALVTFAGDPPGQGGGIFGSGRRAAALTEEPLTSDFERLEASLGRVRDRGAEGLTHMAAGLDRAMIELMGFDGAISEPDSATEKVVLFFTDGQPTLPHDAMFEADNVRAVLRAADRLRKVGIRVHSFAIGPEALDGPVATVEMAARTGGYFTPVRHPGDLVDVVENVSFARIEEVRVRNATTGEEATNLLTNADGSFGALVPLEPGRNRIEVFARARDGSEASTSFTVQHAPDAPGGVDLPRELIAQRNRLLEQRLLELRRERIAAERKEAERTRKELQLEIEREREQARERAERQRKELDLEPERLDADSAPDG